MKKNIIILIFWILSISPIMAHVQLVSPAGGETYETGEVVSISWLNIIDHSSLNWDLLISLDGGASWDTLQKNIPIATLIYQWTVPSNISTEVQIQIVQDNPGVDYYDNSQNFTIRYSTGIKNTYDLSAVSVYPNPFIESATLEFENLNFESYIFTLFNIRGQAVLTIPDIKTDNVIINRGNLPGGLYYFKIYSNQKISKTGKLIIK